MRRCLVLCTLLATASTAHADKKNPETARLLSGVGAAASGGVVLSGFLFAQDAKPFNLPVLYTGIGLLAVTPSLGEIYSGQYLTIGMGIRAAAAGLALYTLEAQTRLAKCDTDPSSEPPRCEIFTENAYPLMGIAAIAFIGGVWYDVLDARDSAERYNRKHGYSVAPVMMQAPHGQAPGMMISGWF